jgi:predicted kinase
MIPSFISNHVQRIAASKWIPFADVSTDLVIEAEELIQKALDQSEPQSKPRLVHLCGIPGSGKSTYAGLYINQNTSFCRVQFDGVMEGLKGYQNDKIELGLIKAFNLWELPARAIGYHLFQALMEGRRNVLFDHSASSADHLTIIDLTKTKGYEVEMHRLNCSPEEAAERVRIREQIIQRYTPEKLIWDRDKLLSELVPLYMAKVDRFLNVKVSQTLDRILPD